MPAPPNRHQRRLESFRLHYYSRYGIRLDDELLLLLIRMSELHRDLRREAVGRPQIAFRHPRDYFWYGLGRWTGAGLMLLATAGMLAWLLR